MPLLVSITGPSAGGQFIDDAGGKFISDEGGRFEDTEGILRLSTENFAGDRYWSGDIINIDPIAWRMDNAYGGASRLSGAGSMEIALNALNSDQWWFQSKTHPCRIEYTSALEADAVLLLDCTLHLRKINLLLSATYDVVPESQDKELLETAVNYDGETVVLPMALGTVTYVKPVRLADSSALIDGWTQKPDFRGEARRSAVAQAIGSKIYLGLGYGLTGEMRDWWMHETAAQTYTWTQKTDFPGGVRESAVSAVVGNIIYTGLGNSSGGQDDWWAYDTTTDTWTQKTDFPGGIRSAAVAAAVGKTIYVGLGISGSVDQKDWWAYNTVTDSWTRLADFGDTARNGSVAVAVGTKIYTGVAQYKDDWWEYNTVTNTWSEKAAFPADGGGMPTGRHGFIGVAVGAAIYIGTGINALYYKDWWLYETTTNAWTQRNDFLGTIRGAAVGVVVGTDIYIGTGQFNNYMKDWWVHGAIETCQRYSAGGLQTCTVYDDGVDVTENASAITNNVFTYNVRPVGEITISSTSPYAYTHQIIPYLCGSSYLNLGCNMAFAGIHPIDRWIDSQINILDVLSAICAAETTYFWIQSGVMTVRSFVAGYSPAVVVDVAADALDGTNYYFSSPVARFRAKWQSRIPVEESVGKYVKEIEQEEVLATAYPYGSELEVDVFTATRSVAAARLAAISARYHLAQISLTMPLQSLAIKPGDALILSDDSFTGREIVAADGIIRDLVFNPINKKWSVEAVGDFFS